MQYINKPESISLGDIEEEIADVEMHLYLLKMFFPISETIRNKKTKKFLSIKDYLIKETIYEKDDQIKNIDKKIDNEIYNEAINYIQKTYFQMNGFSALLMGDVAQLIYILTKIK
jgi:hypothetical protein